MKEKLFRIHGIQLSRYVQLTEEESSPMQLTEAFTLKIEKKQFWVQSGEGRK